MPTGTRSTDRRDRIEQELVVLTPQVTAEEREAVVRALRLRLGRRPERPGPRRVRLPAGTTAFRPPRAWTSAADRHPW
ncbi:hypothetical protein [Streptacidiphilus cavernicola]|uniref:Acyl-CoA carboxylase subunit epsilon n=1 Tax=Streptacidiphilus cavernicola TaxID=3342716 RepID=A0ABV6VP99_9ACTN